jgi:hypothetical protein
LPRNGAIEGVVDHVRNVMTPDFVGTAACVRPRWSASMPVPRHGRRRAGMLRRTSMVVGRHGRTQVFPTSVRMMVKIMGYLMRWRMVLMTARPQTRTPRRAGRRRRDRIALAQLAHSRRSGPGSGPERSPSLDPLACYNAGSGFRGHVLRYNEQCVGSVTYVCPDVYKV